VAGARAGPVVAFIALNLAPTAFRHVVAPQISQLVVVIILTAKNEQFIAAAGSRHRSANLRFLGAVFAFHVVSIQFGALAIEAKSLVAAGSLNKSTENHETSVFSDGERMVVAGQNLFTLFEWHLGPNVFVQIQLENDVSVFLA
jgi:hypothetical protein